MFQFHTGSIKSRGGLEFVLRPISFNSTLVRLKEGIIIADTAFEWRFNSTLVRLKAFHLAPGESSRI